MTRPFSSNAGSSAASRSPVSLSTVSRRAFLAAVPFFPPALHALLKESQPGQRTLLIGTSSNDPSKGIYASGWDPETGQLSAPWLLQATPNPSFMVISRDQRSLYACNEIAGSPGTGKDGEVSAFHLKVDPSELRPLDTVDSGGSGPCHVSLDHTGRCLFVANYASGSIASYRIHSDTSVGPIVSHFQFSGHGPNPTRQAGPHAHGCFPSPDNRFVLANDLGCDRIMIYRLNAATAALAPHEPASFAMPPGSGPRHLAFHPRGKWVYCISELLSTVTQLGWNAQNGSLALLSTISTLPEGFDVALNAAAEVAISGDGRFLYASNRLMENSIAVFSIDEHSGALALVQRISSGGKTPRHFTFDAEEKWLFAGNQDSGNIVVFRRDGRTGKLTQTSSIAGVTAPTCVLLT